MYEKAWKKEEEEEETITALMAVKVLAITHTKLFFGSNPYQIKSRFSLIRLKRSDAAKDSLIWIFFGCCVHKHLSISKSFFFFNFLSAI